MDGWPRLRESNDMAVDNKENCNNRELHCNRTEWWKTRGGGKRRDGKLLFLLEFYITWSIYMEGAFTVDILYLYLLWRESGRKKCWQSKRTVKEETVHIYTHAYNECQLNYNIAIPLNVM